MTVADKEREPGYNTIEAVTKARNIETKGANWRDHGRHLKAARHELMEEREARSNAGL